MQFIYFLSLKCYTSTSLKNYQLCNISCYCYLSRGSPVPAVTPTRGLHTPSTVIRATSSVGSLTEYESLHSEVYRDNVVSSK